MPTNWKVTENATTETLVELFRKSDAPRSERNQAFIFITHRFRKEVLNKCEILCKRFKHDVSTAEMIAERTFESYARKGSFDESKANGKNYDKSFLLYLLSIASNELISHYREIERKKNSPYNGSEEIYFEYPSISEDKLNDLDFEARIEYEIVRGLSSKSKKAIYLTYMVHQRPGFKMPRNLLDSLRTVLGNLSQNTVNAYLKEVRDSIKQAIKAYEVTERIKNNEK